ncbi:MAG: TonB family protein [Rhodothermales bacterium]|nr:TonB family protein [Rhodothermales bacterium]MBO6781003.1 TonB family protein [Rhodothermales bacterium]
MIRSSSISYVCAALLATAVLVAGCAGPKNSTSEQNKNDDASEVPYAVLASHYAAGQNFVRSANCDAARLELQWVMERDVNLHFLNALRLYDLCSTSPESRREVERAFSVVGARMDSLKGDTVGMEAVVRSWRADFEYSARTGQRIQAELDRIPRLKGELPSPRRVASESEYYRGRVLVTALIDATGLPLHAFISETSLRHSYDKAAVEVMQKIEFEPAVAGGTPVREFVTMPVEF